MPSTIIPRNLPHVAAVRLLCGQGRNTDRNHTSYSNHDSYRKTDSLK